MTDTTSEPSSGPGDAGRPASVSARMTGAAGGSDPRGEIAGGGWRLGIVIAVTLGLGVLWGRGALFIIAALTAMIFLHELGHFLAAKWSGMKVTEFFLFFGPKIWSFRRGDTEYGIKLIPVGAYVRIIGMNNLDEVPPEDEARTYRQQSYPKRLLTVSAGSLMHLLQAFVLFVIVFAFVGVPAYSHQAEDLGSSYDASQWSIEEVTPGSAAARAGMHPGDRILEIDGEAIDEFSDIGPLIADRIGDEVPMVVLRGKQEIPLTATIGHRPDEPDRALLGVVHQLPDLPAVTGSLWRSLVVATDTTGTAVKETITGLGSFFTGGVDDFASNVVDGSSSSGPTVSGGSSGDPRPPDEGDRNRLVSIYGVARIGADLSDDGAAFLLLLAMVNISIGVLNMVPLLPLDGGHAAIATYERIRSIRGRRYMADVSRLLPLTYAVFMFLVLIGISSIYLDIVDPIGVG